MAGVNRCFLEVHGSGMPVVFLHGYPLNRSLWNKQVAALERDYQSVLIDLPGFGSASAANKQDTPSLAQIAEEVFEALQATRITEPIVLVGLSMGGYIAFEFWKRHPEALRALVLVDTKASADSPEAIENRRKTAKTAIDDGTQTAVAPMTAKLLGPKSQELVGWLETTMFSISPETIEMAMLAMAQRADFTVELPAIAVPTLVVAGRQDTIVPVDVMNKMAEAIPKAEFHVVDDAAHLTPIEQPEAFNQLLLDFLQSV